MITTFNKNKDWSLLDPRPVLFYHEDADVWCVYWNGMFMLYEYALMLTARHFWSYAPTPEMVRVSDEKFSKLYCLGFFNEIKNDSWAHVIQGNPYNYYIKHLNEHIKTNLKHVHPKDTFKWFEKVYNNEK